MTAQERHELVQSLTGLSVGEQLELIEALIRSLRKANSDHESIQRSMDAMVADPGMQRVLRNEDLEASQAG